MTTIQDQPPPITTEGPALWEVVQGDARSFHDKNDLLTEVLVDMAERDSVGRARYGVPLQAHNGRDALVDAYQEALDMTVYLRQSVAEVPWGDERADRWQVYEESLRMVFVIRRRIKIRDDAKGTGT